MNKKQLTINKETALAIVRLAKNITSKDATRYHLQMVEMRKLDNEHVELAATDGHIAVWVKIKDEKLALEMTKEPVYFHADNADILKALEKMQFGRVVFSDFETGIKFPNMDQFRIKSTVWTETIYKDKAPPEIEINRSFTIGFNIKFMQRIEKAFAPSRGGGVSMTMDTRDKLKPFLITSTSTELKEEAVVMPMRL